jgi:hypothetical protein
LRWRSKNGGDCGGGEEMVVLFLLMKVMNLNLWVVDEVEEEDESMFFNLHCSAKKIKL